MKLVGIVGSNAEVSYNRKLMEFIAKEYKDLFTLELLDITNLPMFNQDEDHSRENKDLLVMNRKILQADGVIIATPEHNHTITASLKSALEWLSFELHPLENKPVTFTLNYAAYFAEIFRGGIESIPKGQYEAAKVLKFTQFQTIRFVILPQVIKIVLPSVFNEIMSLVKDTSLVYALGISDLILASRTAANRDASLLQMFVAGAIYLILIGIVTIVSKQVEKRYNYDRR